jgi:hypothetical protein
MSNKKNAFDGFSYEKPVVRTLKSGSHAVVVNSTSRTDSFHLLDGTAKEGIAESVEAEEKWSDSTPQLAVVFVSNDEETGGVMTYRFNALGYKHRDDFTQEELDSEKYISIGDYVCVRNKQNKIVRIKSDARTLKAKRILNQFLLATDAKQGEDLDLILDRCIADKTKISITVKKGSYNDRDTFDISKFSPVEETVASEGVEDDDF